MTKRSDTIWHYTPSNTPPEELEAMLIEREPLLRELHDAVRLCVEGRGTRHFLIVGPRGAGKTHLISVLKHRLANDPELRPKIAIGWMPEDMFGMGQAINWFRTLADELSRREELPGLAELIAQLKSPEERTAESVGQLIVSTLGDRTLVIMHENLNRVFRQLGRVGQQTIRAFLQNHPNILLVATTPSINEAISSHDAPFYGAFSSRSLEELSCEGTLDLFIRLAQQRGDDATEKYLETNVGKGRVRAVHVLAGSNPRILVVFAAFTSRSGLEQLLPLFERTIDSLTPYYQERMESLAPQQQEVLQLFLRLGSALSPSAIAEQLWLDPRVVAKVLGNLVELGYLRRRQDGNRTWYDLREPLMKMSWQIKDARTEPLQLIVDFVRVWFTPLEAKEQSQLAPTGSSVQRTLMRAAELGWKLDLDPMDGFEDLEGELSSTWYSLGPNDRIKACERLIVTKSKLAQPAEFLTLAWAHYLAGNKIRADELLTAYRPRVSTAEDFHRLCALLAEMRDMQAANDAIENALELNPDDARTWITRSCCLVELGRLDEALAAVDHALKLYASYENAWFNKSCILEKLGRHEEALEAIECALKLDVNDAVAWSQKSYCLEGLGRLEDALEAATCALSIHPGLAVALAGRLRSLVRLGREEEARAAATEWQEVDPNWHELRLLAAAQAIALGNADEFRDLSRKGLRQAAEVSSFGGGLTEIAEAMFEYAAEGSYAGLAAHLVETVFLRRLHEEVAKAVVETIPDLLSEQVSQSRAEQWLLAWQEAARGNDAYAISLRILQTAVQYKAEPSQRHLLQLPAEERAILASLLPDESPKLRGRRPSKRKG